MSEKRPHIVIVGGGFAGANVTRLLQRRAKFADITLVSEESYTTFNPMLAEVVGATVFPEHVVAPLRATVGRARFIMRSHNWSPITSRTSRSRAAGFPLPACT